MKTSYEFTLTFPVTLLRTDAGLALRCVLHRRCRRNALPDAVFEGVTEDDFYSTGA